MKLKISHLVFETDRPVMEDALKLRGFIGGMFPSHTILHHHGGTLIYQYPLVQYKVIQGTPSIVGIMDGAEVLKEISDKLKYLRLGLSHYEIKKMTLHIREESMGEKKKNEGYRFITPWLSLNQKNFESWKNLSNWKEKKELLHKILVGNILSMSKSLGVVVEKELSVHTHLDPVNVHYKGIAMTGFIGYFRTNFHIPEYFGIGKGVSQGFGIVTRGSPSSENVHLSM